MMESKICGRGGSRASIFKILAQVMWMCTHECIWDAYVRYAFEPASSRHARRGDRTGAKRLVREVIAEALCAHVREAIAEALCAHVMIAVLPLDSSTLPAHHDAQCIEFLKSYPPSAEAQMEGRPRCQD